MNYLKKTSTPLALAVVVLSSVVLLISWDFKQTSPVLDDQPAKTDTIPKKEKKIRDLDEALDELDKADLQLNMEKIQKEIAAAIEKINSEKIKLEVEKALKEVDLEKIKNEVESSLANINRDKLKAGLEKMKEVDLTKIEADLKKAKEELNKMGPEIEKSLEKAKAEIEKARTEIKEYNDFVTGLEKDGLLNRKENYSIVHQDGELFVNNKKVSDSVYKKYKSFLDKHTKFNIKKSEDDFKINKD